MIFKNETLKQMQEQAIRNAIAEYSYTAPPLPQNLSYSEMLLYNKAMEGRWRCIKEVAQLAIPQFYKLLLDEADITPRNRREANKQRTVADGGDLNIDKEG